MSKVLDRPRQVEDRPIADVLNIPLLKLDTDDFPDVLWVLEDSKQQKHGMGFSGIHNEHGVACFPTKGTAIRYTEWITTPDIKLQPKEVTFDDARDIVKSKPPTVRCLLYYKDGNVKSEPKVHFVK